MDRRIEEWRAFLLKHRAADPAVLDQLVNRLEDNAQVLAGAGLEADEALLVAMRRIASSDVFPPGFAREHARWMCGQWAMAPGDEGSRGRRGRDALVAVGLAIAAAVAFRLPELFGFHISDAEELDLFYVRNFGFFVTPFLAAYFAWKRALTAVDLVPPATLFAAGLVVMNAYPFAPRGQTILLAAFHLLLVLWLAAGYAYSGGLWRDHQWRLQFVRFSGEWFIQYVLIALGGGVFVLVTVFLFEAIGLDAADFLVTWVVPSGVVGVVIIAAALVDSRNSLAGNMAPVLTRLFTPLFTLALLAFLASAAWTGSGIRAERELLIGFDLLLVLVLGLVLYSVSARDPRREPGFFDALQLVLVLCALAVDALALWAILGRIAEFGLSPNRAAGLGLNLVMVVNLGWAAVLLSRFLAGRAGFEPVVRWQTAYLPVYAAWAGVVVVVFPPLFGFV